MIPARLFENDESRSRESIRARAIMSVKRWFPRARRTRGDVLFRADNVLVGVERAIRAANAIVRACDQNGDAGASISARERSIDSLRFHSFSSLLPCFSLMCIEN